MLHQFLTANREEIIARTQAKVAGRSAPRPTAEELQTGIPLFLSMLIESLRLSSPLHSQESSQSAARHGGALLKMGFTVAQVVHDYGDVCQAVTELADEMKAPITAHEFQIFNGCLDDAIAEAVTEYVRQREHTTAAEGIERLGVLAHEMRNRLHASMLALEIIKKGSVGIGGSTSAVLSRNLRGLGAIIDRSLAEVRLEAAIHTRERVTISALVEEVEIDASLEANARGLVFTVTPVERGVEVEVDRQLFGAALTNLLHNAFKFTHAHSHVSLRTTATAHRVLFEVEDECGGLPPGKAEELFRPFEQRSSDKTGLGLGLSISRKGVTANGGTLHVRDVPGKGCVFTIDLPRRLAP